MRLLSPWAAALPLAAVPILSWENKAVARPSPRSRPMPAGTVNAEDCIRSASGRAPP